jgi:hypothetical protein
MRVHVEAGLLECNTCHSEHDGSLSPTAHCCRPPPAPRLVDRYAVQVSVVARLPALAQRQHRLTDTARRATYQAENRKLARDSVALALVQQRHDHVHWHFNRLADDESSERRPTAVLRIRTNDCRMSVASALVTVQSAVADAAAAAVR